MPLFSLFSLRSRGQVPFERRMQTFTVFAYMFLFLFGGLATTVWSIYMVLYSENWKWLPCLYWAWYIWDYDTGETGGRDYL